MKPHPCTRRWLQRFALLIALTCVARGAPHDFTTGNGTSPGGPNDPNDGQPPCHNGSSSDPDLAGDSDPVDIFRGELILDRRDLFVPGRGLGVDVTFHYRSQSVENGQFGYGWTFSYSRRIIICSNRNNSTVCAEPPSVRPSEPLLDSPANSIEMISGIWLSDAEASRKHEHAATGITLSMWQIEAALVTSCLSHRFEHHA